MKLLLIFLSLVLLMCSCASTPPYSVYCGNGRTYSCGQVDTLLAVIVRLGAELERCDCPPPTP